ncbi:MAG: hypothetical protein ABII07_01945 [Patescibacteria group bacterium]|nr:hypothetical protein [Patescibacteria group bacterium]
MTNNEEKAAVYMEGCHCNHVKVDSDGHDCALKMKRCTGNYGEVITCVKQKKFWWFRIIPASILWIFKEMFLRSACCVK